MADNYLRFSAILPALSSKEQSWVRRLLAESASRKDLARAGIDVDAIDPEMWPGFSWEIEQPSGELWLYSQDCCDPQHVGQFVRAFLARFRPRECWGLTWAETCSRPIVGEFGGGGIFVTAREIQTFNVHEWLRQRQKAFLKTKPAGKGHARPRSKNRSRRVVTE